MADKKQWDPDAAPNREKWLARKEAERKAAADKAAHQDARVEKASS